MLKCKTVRIKFTVSGMQQEEVSVQQINGAQYIEVLQSDGFLRLECKAEKGQIVKQINYRIQDVREYAVTDTVWQTGSTQLELSLTSIHPNCPHNNGLGACSGCK